MQTGAVVGNIDVAQLVLYAFWIFFTGLIFYLRREDRREGYPLLSATDGTPQSTDPIFFPDPKPFHLASGKTVYAPSGVIDQRAIAALPTAGWSGAPLEPTGNPMIDAVGPAAYAERAEEADVTAHGIPRIVPLRSDHAFGIEGRDPDPREMTVYGADNESGGTVRDVWIDRSDMLIRYLEVEVKEGKRVLLPINFCKIDKWVRRVNVNAVLAAHFVHVPAIAKPDTVTLREEDRICAYYGGGQLYATKDRQEPVL